MLRNLFSDVSLCTAGPARVRRPSYSPAVEALEAREVPTGSMSVGESLAPSDHTTPSTPSTPHVSTGVSYAATLLDGMKGLQKLLLQRMQKNDASKLKPKFLNNVGIIQAGLAREFQKVEEYAGNDYRFGEVRDLFNQMNLSISVTRAESRVLYNRITNRELLTSILNDGISRKASREIKKLKAQGMELFTQAGQKIDSIQQALSQQGK